MEHGCETPHLISHYLAGSTDMSVRLRVARFAEVHKAYTAQVASGILSKKGQTLDNYLWSLVQNSTPFDEIAIFLASRCLNIHTRIFVGDHVWSTKANGDISGEFQFSLVNKGDLLFFNTVSANLNKPTVGGVRLNIIEDEEFDNTMPVDIIVVAAKPGNAVLPTPVVKTEKTEKKPKGKKRKKKKQPQSTPKPKRPKPAPLAVSLRSSATPAKKERVSRTSAKAREAAKLIDKSLQTQHGLFKCSDIRN